MNKNLFTTLFAILFLVSLFYTAVAHDYWLSPKRFALVKGETLIVNLLVGGEMKPEVERPLQKAMTKSFTLVTTDGTIDLLPEIADSTLPVLTRKLDFEGMALVSMERDFWNTKMTDEQFTRSLEHEEMHDVIKLREKIGRKEEEHKRYDRSIKALIKVGDKMDGELYKKALGHKVELLLQQNPFKLKSGDSISVQALYHGKPLANKMIKALNGDGQKLLSQQKAYTNENGVASFTVDAKGVWLIRLSHLWHCPECEDVDWENHYSTYSFSLE